MSQTAVDLPWSKVYANKPNKKGNNMITRENIANAMRVLEGHGAYMKPLNNAERQIVSSLYVYASRGEYQGTYGSAIECLMQAEYEIEE